MALPNPRTVSPLPAVMVAVVVAVVVTGVTGAGGCARASGPAPLWSADPAADNAFPDERLQGDDGALRVTPAILRPFLPLGVDTPETDTLLAGWAEQLRTVDGAGRAAPVLVRFEAPLDELLAEHPLDEARLRFVVLDGSGDDAMAARATWHADPGVLEVQPLLPLPAHSRVALVVERGLLTGLRLGRATALDAWLQDAGRVDVEEVEKVLGIAADDVATLVPFRTANTGDGLLQARDIVGTTPPVFTFDDTGDGRHGVFSASTAPASLSGGDEATLLAQAGTVAVGFFTSKDLRDPETRLFKDDVLRGDTPPTDADVEVVVIEPDPARFPPPWPAVILQHGFGGSSAFVVENAAPFLERGLAVLGIDAVSHGGRGVITAFFRFDDPRVVRDNLRQTVVDQLVLGNLATRGDIDVDGVPGRDLDGSLAYFGHSMGAVVGSMFAMVSRDVDVVAINAPGGGLCRVFRSESLMASLQLLVRPSLGIGLDDPSYAKAFPLLTAMAQPLFEGADPIVQARATDRPRLLLQLDVDDRLVPNSTTRDLARALDVPERAGAHDDDAGFSALTVLSAADFPAFPADENPHNLVGVPVIQAQAAAFVASRGTRLLSAP